MWLPFEVVFVPHQLHVLIWHVFHEFEGAGPYGVGIPYLRLVQLLERDTFEDVFRTYKESLPERVQEPWIWLVQDELDCMSINDLNSLKLFCFAFCVVAQAFECRQQCGIVVRWLEVWAVNSLHRPFHIFSGERLTVVPLDVIAQVNRPDQAIV